MIININKYIDHFYKRKGSREVNLEYFALLRKHMANLKLTFDGDYNLIYSNSDVICEKDGLSFHVQTAIRNNELMVSFYFSIYFGNEATFFVNCFNFIADPSYRAYVGSSGYHSYFVTIEHYVKISDINDALKEFKAAVNYIINGRGVSAIGMIYDTYSQELLKTKEMN